MSKKIKIAITDKVKPNLRMLFRIWINRVIEESNNISCQYDEDEWMSMLGISDDEYFDDCETVFPFSNDVTSISDDDAYEMYWAKQEAKAKAKYHKRKHHKKNKRKKFNLNVPYSGWEEDPDIVGDDSDFDERERFDDHCTIWYYPQYYNKSGRLEFNSLKDFDDFCFAQDFVIPPYIAEEIVYRPISHVCLRPQSAECGVHELFAAESYADMVYGVCDINELSQ